MERVNKHFLSTYYVVSALQVSHLILETTLKAGAVTTPILQLRQLRQKDAELQAQGSLHCLEEMP